MKKRPDKTVSPRRLRSTPAWPAGVVSGVDGRTGLASDFLNQFNEVVMLLDLVASGDERLFDELDAWRPRSYEACFGAPGNRDGLRILDSYRSADAPLRRRLDALAGELSALVLAGIVFLMSSRRDGSASPAASAARLATEVRTRLDRLDAIVHAGARRPTQDEVSALFENCAV